MLRAIIGTVVGCVVAIAVITGVEMAGAALFPRGDADLRDPEGMKALVAGMPMAAKLMVLAAWWLGAAVGGWVANRVGRTTWPALVVGLVIAAAVVANVMMLPHPLWMQIAGVLGPLAIGGTLWRARRAAA